ncbi:hypothetical protein EZS27_026491 [termite gut metagenome]|uniref:Uncharacterized protein n=1 Tax=termite gut metagenome TaxID=433724 RepID=A0A5J4QQC7_9ZZZZ
MKHVLKIIFMVAVVHFMGCNHHDKSKIEASIRKQLEKYPELRLQDIYKNFYQDCFGTGHAIPDTAMVLNYLKNELQNTVSMPSAPMVELLGWQHNFVRIHIDWVRQGKISAEKLAEAFIVSASKINEKDTGNWKNEWKTITRIIEENHLPVKNYEIDKAIIDSVLRENPNRAMHHSTAFNENYNPHYRVIEKSVFENMLGKEVDFQQNSFIKEE